MECHIWFPRHSLSTISSGLICAIKNERTLSVSAINHSLLKNVNTGFPTIPRSQFGLQFIFWFTTNISGIHISRVPATQGYQSSHSHWHTSAYLTIALPTQKQSRILYRINLDILYFNPLFSVLSFDNRIINEVSVCLSVCLYITKTEDIVHDAANTEGKKKWSEWSSAKSLVVSNGMKTCNRSVSRQLHAQLLRHVL